MQLFEKEDAYENAKTGHLQLLFYPPRASTLYLRWILLHMINLLPHLTCMTGNLRTRFITVHVYILGIGWGGLYHSPDVV